MKRVFLILLVVAVLFMGCWMVGCSAINKYVATDTGALVVKKAGRMAGIVTGFEEPEDVDKMISYCNSLLEEKDETLKKAAVQVAYKYIYKRYGKNEKTVIVMAEVSDIVGVIIKDDKLSFLDDYDFIATDMFVTAFRDGLILTK